MKVMPDSPHRISPAGILDGSQGNAVLHQVSEALEQGGTSIEIDMDAVTFMDSAGFGALVIAFKNVKAAGGRFRLLNVNTQVRLVLEITGTDRMLMLLEDNETTP